MGRLYWGGNNIGGGMQGGGHHHGNEVAVRRGVGWGGSYAEHAYYSDVCSLPSVTMPCHVWGGGRGMRIYGGRWEVMQVGGGGLLVLDNVRGAMRGDPLTLTPLYPLSPMGSACEGITPSPMIALPGSHCGASLACGGSRTPLLAPRRDTPTRSPASPSAPTVVGWPLAAWTRRRGCGTCSPASSLRCSR